MNVIDDPDYFAALTRMKKYGIINWDGRKDDEGEPITLTKEAVAAETRLRKMSNEELGKLIVEVMFKEGKPLEQEDLHDAIERRHKMVVSPDRMNKVIKLLMKNGYLDKRDRLVE